MFPLKTTFYVRFKKRLNKFSSGEHCHLEDKCFNTGKGWINPCGVDYFGKPNLCDSDWNTGEPLCTCEKGTF